MSNKKEISAGLENPNKVDNEPENRSDDLKDQVAKAAEKAGFSVLTDFKGMMSDINRDLRVPVEQVIEEELPRIESGSPQLFYQQRN